MTKPVTGTDLHLTRGDGSITTYRKLVSRELAETPAEAKLRAELWEKHKIVQPRRRIEYYVERERPPITEKKQRRRR